MDALLAAYDATRDLPPDPLPADVVVERDGPLLRLVGLGGGGFIGYRSVAALPLAELDALIARQRDYFHERGEPVEWKLHGHDKPHDLSDRLLAAGFEPEEQETVVAAPVADILSVPPPALVDVSIRTVTSRTDIAAAMKVGDIVWGRQREWITDALLAELAAGPDSLVIFVAEAPAGMVCAAWIRFAGNSPFATLWGGATLPEYRGRGIYRTLVFERARLAAARGYDYLQVDASDDSRPILQRLGFMALTSTTPYVYTPHYLPVHG